MASLYTRFRVVESRVALLYSSFGFALHNLLGGG